MLPIEKPYAIVFDVKIFGFLILNGNKLCYIFQMTPKRLDYFLCMSFYWVSSDTSWFFANFKVNAYKDLILLNEEWQILVEPYAALPLLNFLALKSHQKSAQINSDFSFY